MIIEMFGEYGRGLEIDSEDAGLRAVQLPEGPSVKGIGAVVEGSLIAFYCDGGDCFLRIGDDKWRAGDEVDRVDFSNEDNGVSRITVKKGGVLVRSFSYPSWWVRSAGVAPVGLGDEDDAEQDIGAYLAFMWQTDERRKHLQKKYSS